jgi:TRAP-type C4-dicarboxylate transport system substrate-binding protein
MLFALLLVCVQAKSQEYTMKFATVAPDGSTWMNVMREFDAAIRTESGGKLGFKIYAGGVQGDEKDVLRKIRLGQLQAAGITGNGMTEIAPKARILDSPFLFRTYDEVDHVYRAFDGELKAAFEEHGYVNLGWAEVGFVYIFTNDSVRTPEDMRRVKMWMWEGDPVAEASLRAIGIKPIPLAITDVLTSLQTRLIDGVYTVPIAAIALQWFTRVKYMLDAPLANSSGAVVIAKRSFDGLPPNLQDILRRNGEKYMAKLTQLSREENARSIDALKKNGIIVIKPGSQQVLSSYEEIGQKARRMLVGKLYPEDLLMRVERSVSDFRHQQTGSAK